MRDSPEHVEAWAADRRSTSVLPGPTVRVARRPIVPSVIESTAGRLHLVLQPTSEDVHEPEYRATAPLVRMTAYRDRERIFGWLQLGANRLTDMLNAHTELHLRDVEMEHVDAGTTQAVEGVLITRRELIAVAVGEPRGDPALRRPTRSHPIAIQLRDYLVGGYLHVAPGVDPLADFWERPTLVPLTDAWIELWSGDRRSCQSTGTIIVNRDLVDGIRVVADDDLIGGLLRPSGRNHSRGASASAPPDPSKA